jgi:hypothetical protein
MSRMRDKSALHQGTAVRVRVAHAMARRDVALRISADAQYQGTISTPVPVATPVTAIIVKPQRSSGTDACSVRPMAAKCSHS